MANHENNEKPGILHVEACCDADTDTTFYTRREIDEELDKIADGGGCSPSWAQLQGVLANAYDLVGAIRPSTRRVVFTFDPEENERRFDARLETMGSTPVVEEA